MFTKPSLDILMPSAIVDPPNPLADINRQKPISFIWAQSFYNPSDCWAQSFYNPSDCWGAGGVERKTALDPSLRVGLLYVFYFRSSSRFKSTVSGVRFFFTSSVTCMYTVV